MSQINHKMTCGCVYSVDVFYDRIDGICDVEDIGIEAYCAKHDPRAVRTQLRTLREALDSMVKAEEYDANECGDKQCHYCYAFSFEKHEENCPRQNGIKALKETENP